MQPKNWAQNIIRTSQKLQGIQITNLDFENVIDNAPDGALLFLDPPYFQKGQSLYLNHYNNKDHENLSEFLGKSSLKKWIMTYDDVSYIKNLYTEMYTKGFAVQHNAYQSKIGREVMIFPKGFVPVKI